MMSDIISNQAHQKNKIKVIIDSRNIPDLIAFLVNSKLSFNLQYSQASAKIQDLDIDVKPLKTEDIFQQPQ